MPFDVNVASPVNAQDFSRPAAATQGLFGQFTAAAGAVTTSAGLTVAVAAVPASSYLINGTIVATAYVASTIAADAAHATLYRRDLVYIDTAGAVGIAAGTAAALTAALAPTLAATRYALAELTIAPAQTTLASTDIIDKRLILQPALTTRVITKSVDETVNNSVTLQNDDEMLAALSASTRYWFVCVVSVDSSGIADFKVAFTVPTGATVHYNTVYPNTASVLTFAQSNASAGTIALQGLGAGTPSGNLIVGYVNVGTTAGNLQLQWAQDTATAVNTTVLANSYLEAHK